MYVSAASLHDDCQALHARDIVNISLIDDMELGPTGPEPPYRPPHSPQMKFVSSVLSATDGWAKATTLPDDGCSGQVVSRNFVQQHRLDTVTAAHPVHLRLANGKVVGRMDTMARVNMKIGDHVSVDWMWVTDLAGYDVIVGQPWLETHDVAKSYSRRTITFDSEHCMKHCLAHHRAVRIHCPAGKAASITTLEFEATEDIAFISADAAMRFARRDKKPVTWILPEHWDALRDVSKMLDSAIMTIDCAAASPEDFGKFHEKLTAPKLTREEITARLPKAYRHLAELWDPKEADVLPTSKPGVDHEIRLVEGAGAPHQRPFGLSRNEMMALKAYIDEELRKGFIRPSSSPYAAPVLVVRKPGGGLRICIDYRQLNALTIKNRNAPPKIRDTLARLNRVRIFSKFDVIAAFNRVLVKACDREKTAFLTRFGLYEYNVMPFGLCNAPGTFQSFINHTLREFLDRFTSAYLDDVLVYSESEEEHVQHNIQVLTKLREAGLYLDIRKTEFHVKRVKYLGMILSTEGLQMDPDKVKAIREWSDLRTIKDVQAFVGFANFYRRFIFKFSQIVRPLIELIKATPPGQRLDFNNAARAAFEELKAAFTSDVVLAHFDPDKKAVVECDASDWVVSGILSQWHEGLDRKPLLRPVAYFSMKMQGAELNYPIYDKELMAIIRAFEEWRPELSGTDEPIEVFSDHRTLQWFMTTKQLNRRQARWAEFLSEFNFVIKYRPGKQGTKPDSLTRRTGDVPAGVEDDRIQQQQQQLLQDHMFEKPSPDEQVYVIATTHHDDGCYHAVDLALILSNDVEMSLVDLVESIYSIGEETCCGSEELLIVALNREPDSSGDDEEVREPDNGDEPTYQEPVVGGDYTDAAAIIDQIREATRIDDTLQRVISCKADRKQRLPYDLIKSGLKLELSSCRTHDDLLYVKDRIFVPADEALRAKVIALHHESLPGGHSGRHGTYEKLMRNYYWPHMTSTVAQYVRNCLTCQRSKPHKEGRHGLLNPLPIPDSYWRSISIDFITPLPPCKYRSRTYRHIMVVVDRLSKKKKFIPLESLDVDTVVQAFIEFIWREEGYPDEVISDRGAQFTSHFWSRLCSRIGTRPKLSTSHHPETDGQTEIANALLKQYLRAYVLYDQSNWVELLPFAEFHVNNTVTASTGVTPFYATKGYHPRSGIEPPTEQPPMGWKAARDSKSADRLLERIDQVKQFLQWNLLWAQDKMEEQANRHRSPAPEYQEGDLVMLDARNVRTRQNNKGLSPKNLGPFKVLESFSGKAYKLDFAGHNELCAIYPVFHPWLLHPVENRPLPGQRQVPQGPVDVDEDGDLYEVEAILDAKVDRRRVDRLTGKRGMVSYLLKWKGYDQPDWEDYTNVTGCTELLRDFHERRPDVAMPASLQSTKAHEERLAFLWIG